MTCDQYAISQQKKIADLRTKLKISCVKFEEEQRTTKVKGSSN